MVNDKVVVITGSASGIGYEIGKTFAENGSKVVLTDLNEEGVKASAQELKDLGYEAIGLKADVTSEEDIKNMIQAAHKEYGRIDVLINNAGLQHVSPIEEFPTEKFELMIKIMLTAPFVAIKHVLPIMKEQKFGRILNISSINGLIGFAGKAAYNSAKHGVIGLTKVAALESAADGVTVNSICPGYVDTPLVRGQMKDIASSRNVPVEKVLEEVIYPLVPQKRLLDVKEIADYAMFLSSDQAKSVTGQAVVIDGGYTAQ
ncbi:3-hydroxybutyrate dehydrogenase [Rossellomorea marisflavi]|uniref:3-hydroxybutyrate dehydrogenase n=1 Tax=Rossellomorea marisflavi TaxID=189381 RepID=A0A5D4RKD7_9BACI|nr:3-hydroxybutyrate dehydrogenase [Rossellomorea marisflavi]KMK95784.1 3-hydroxybutyrate dehydrogenase [Rossellomorea marisflavi]KML08482.1 3-hydroxybutyrate dehydrogenase [Rossellomorea marisflavi]KML32451.1 3-hydroxybutyrate dehydrogenase [Rossellomorea marisflavi]QHA38109.1 3-hydroxybutyrate dehydrogenase [Rossellomorea marisflavi]TYO74149.1 3-hydroxybutyrate dehydrogenase [Rossellomorea marisflavi]